MNGCTRGVALVVLVGCSTSHGGAALDASPDASRDAAPRPDGGPDAGCTTILEGRSCSALWALPLGVFEGEAVLSARGVRSAADGTTLLGLSLGGLTRARVGDRTLDRPALVALGPDGAPRWVAAAYFARGAFDGVDTWVSGLSDAGEATLERRATLDGRVLETLTAPDSELDELAVYGCPGCMPVFAAGWSWRTPMSEVVGTTMRLWNSGGTVWETRIEEPPLPHYGFTGLALPTSRDASGGLTVAWTNHFREPSDHRVCPVPDGPCAGPDESVLVSHDASGGVRWTAFDPHGVRSVHMLADGSTLVRRSQGVARFDPEGTMTWAFEPPRRFVEAVVADEPRGLAWATVDILGGDILEIDGARLRECRPLSAFPTSHWTTALVRLDLATGAAEAVWLPAFGVQIVDLSLRPTGGIDLVGRMEGDAEVDVCGGRFTRADDPGAPILIVVAAIDPT